MCARIIQVDSFTNRPFAGNPAAVCLLDGPAPDRWMQDVAAEMNLSETAFVSPFQPAGVYKLRWFTPNVEVDLCGHATLATAHVLWEEGMVAVEKPALFETRSGRLTATRRGDWIELDFPAEPLNVAIDDPGELDSLASAINSPVVSAGRNRLDLLVELADEQAVRNLRPDIRRVASFPVRGVIVTSPGASQGVDFVSRFFAPGRRRRRPGLRLGTLLPGPLLGREARPQRAHRPPGLAPGRGRQGPRRRPPRRPHRPGRHGDEGGACRIGRWRPSPPS